MENLEWKPVFYNGLETNIEVTKCGRVRRVRVDWMQRNTLIGEIDFSKLKLHKKGYKMFNIQIKGLKQKTIYVHQLIAAVFLGYKWQGNNLVIDHIDSDKLNNNLSNLRIITNRENVSKERTIKSGLPAGVWFDKSRNKYKSGIRLNNIKIHLGYYNTIEDASNAYQNKLKEL